MEIMTLDKKMTMTSLEVAEITGKEHKNIIRDIEDETEKLGIEVGGLIFELTSYTDKSNRKSKMYNLTRDGVLQLGARYDARMRFTLIQRMNRLEEKVNLDSYMIADPVERAKKWIQETEEKKALEIELKENAPRVNFAKTVELANGDILVREFSKLLGNEKIYLGEKKLYQWFRDHGYIIKSRTEPTQKSIQKGLFSVSETIIATPKGSRPSFITKVTGKGQIYFLEKIKKHTSGQDFI
ncbi:MAG: phage antirepressor KilAC domain-containing protein [Cetobacterium sp.]